MKKVAIVGSGWRAGFFIRLAALQPDRYEIVGVVARSEAARQEIAATFGIATFSTLEEFFHSDTPDFVIVAVSWEANPEIVKGVVSRGIPVLCETPPAPDLDGLRQLWSEVGGSDLVQVAEQYLYLPGHAARLSAIRSGEIGRVGSVEVSSTHGYHAISMMRGFMDAGYAPTSVIARSFAASLVDPLMRDSWNSHLEPVNKSTAIALIDFGEQRSGIYNFVDNQWHNQLRHRRLVIRASHGEIVDDSLIKLVEGPAIVSTNFIRSQSGIDLNLDGFETQHISMNGRVIFSNPFIGLRFMDEEIAIASMMLAMCEWLDGRGDAPYPLRSACQDHLVALAIEESLKTGLEVRTQEEIWSL